LDVKVREVSDWVWLLSVPVCLALTVLEVSLGGVMVQAVLVSVVIAFGLGLILSYSGLVGGADAKALFLLSLAVPIYLDGFPVLGDLLGIPVIAVFCNSILLSMISPLSVFALNITDVLRGKSLFRGVEVSVLGKAVLLFTSRRVSLSKLDGSLHYFPAEALVKENERFKRKPLHFVDAEADIKALIRDLKENVELYRDGVLASPTIPMIVFYTLGLMLLPLGNLILLFLQAIVNLYSAT